ncbi:phage endolysin [Bacillus sp. JCM 19046]|uniref:Peptidoglycan L-alanyl-D-glutamate endopeptidase CwlK n=1 Tax=Shouchella xiaoxiensis TaxID=766895 RepID=A0ABS2ST46_9BACI|nr:peptidoglycan L-alanyl-D-glutamate endopeptidase CwlK [Shouchella xiaoxiensis]GAF11830.1 phage endolysin [Bacillus sp. JCM 19045]GAF16124.1 phage endolysin [Bacillus sp. JCM 19046]
MRSFLKSFIFLFVCVALLIFMVFYINRDEAFNGVESDSFIDITHIENTLAQFISSDKPEVEIEEIIYAEGLHPIIEEKTEQLIEHAAAVGIDLMITDGFRSIEEQNELFRQGRSAGGKIVTNAMGGQSLHNFGLAVDYALLNQSGQPIWDLTYDGNNNGEPDWFEVAELAKDLGFEWGGDWTDFVDFPHLQMTFGYTIEEIQQALLEAEGEENEELLHLQ